MKLINLCSATTGLTREGRQLDSTEAEKFEMLNNYSKPGGYYELFVGEDGVVEWRDQVTEEVYDEGVVSVRFNPRAMKLEIAVGKGVCVEVTKKETW